MMSGGNHIGVYLLLLDAKVIPVRNSLIIKLFLEKIEFTCLEDDFGLFVNFSLVCCRICRRLSSKSPSASWLHLSLR